VVVHPEGTHLLIALADGSVRLWNLDGNYEQQHLRHSIGAFADMAFSPDGAMIATMGRDGSFRTWSVAQPQFAPLGTGRQQTAHLLFTESKAAIVGKMPGGEAGSLALPPNTSGIRSVESTYDNLGQLVVSAEGRHVVISSYELPTYESAAALYTLQDTSDMTLSAVARLHPDFYLDTGCRSCISPDGRRLAYIAEGLKPEGEDGDDAMGAHCPAGIWCVLIWDVQAGKVSAVLEHSAGLAQGGVAFSPTAPMAATLDAEGILRLWPLDASSVTGEPLPATESFPGAVRQISFAPDGRHVVVLGWDGVLNVWDVRHKTRHSNRTDEGGAEPKVARFVFAPQSTDLVVLIDRNLGSVERDPDLASGVQVQRWRIDTLAPNGDELRTQGDSDARFAVVQHEGNLLVALSTPMNTIEVWDQTHAQWLFTVEMPVPAQEIAFTPDGESIVAIDAEGLARTWPVDVQHLLETACASVGREMRPGEQETYFGAAAPNRTTCEGI
jgi:WD40 repeat protein